MEVFIRQRLYGWVVVSVYDGYVIHPKDKFFFSTQEEAREFAEENGYEIV